MDRKSDKDSESSHDEDINALIQEEAMFCDCIEGGPMKFMCKKGSKDCQVDSNTKHFYCQKCLETKHHAKPVKYVNEYRQKKLSKLKGYLEAIERATKSIQSREWSSLKNFLDV